ncbi:MAG: hypothetical protein N2450_08725 [bacterium]|nr:hypothetical protein [bacterium]
MKRLITALIVTTVYLSSTIGATWKVIEPPPKSKHGFPVAIGGKLIRYSPATHTNPLVVNIEGPSILRVSVRVAASTSVRQYQVLAALDDGLPVEFNETAGPARDAEGPNGLRLTARRDLDFRIPDGQHKLVLKPSDTTTLYLRISKRVFDTGEPQQWQSMAPRGFKDLVGIVVREQEATYYRQTSERPLELRINGPTKLRIISRAEVPGGNEERIFKWRIEVKSNGQSLGVFPCEETISNVATHAKESDYVVTSGSTINLNLPEGKHNISIHVLDKDIRVLNRIFIPKTSLKNTGK